MKKIFLQISIVILGVVYSPLTYSQNNDVQIIKDEDNLKRKILIDYIEQIYFEYSTPKAEAIANIIIKVFRENLTIINPDLTGISEDDALKISSLKYAFQQLLNTITISWSDIIQLETERLIRIDKETRRKSKYEINNSNGKN